VSRGLAVVSEGGAGDEKGVVGGERSGITVRVCRHMVLGMGIGVDWSRGALRHPQSARHQSRKALSIRRSAHWPTMHWPEMISWGTRSRNSKGAT